MPSNISCSVLVTAACFLRARHTPFIVFAHCVRRLGASIFFGRSIWSATYVIVHFRSPMLQRRPKRQQWFIVQEGTFAKCRSSFLFVFRGRRRSRTAAIRATTLSRRRPCACLRVYAAHGVVCRRPLLRAHSVTVETNWQKGQQKCSHVG